MKVLIDADPIVYQVGFACEDRWYELAWEDNGTVKFAWFYYKERLNEFMELRNIVPEEVVITLEREAEPLRNALSTAKKKLNNILDAVDGFLAETGEAVDEYQLYLTDGASNYRNKIATIAGYKANRDPLHKPIYYKEIRDYLTEVWGARIIRGAEADDAVAIAQWQQGNFYDTCIATIDKDLKMVPGLHYNYLSQEAFSVDERQALYWFWKQVLTGDATDNIKGCYRVGPKLATELLHTLDEIKIPELFDEAAYAVVLEAYEYSIKRYGKRTGYAELGAEAAVLENARLLWMQQWPGQLWTPPGEPWAEISAYEDN